MRLARTSSWHRPSLVLPEQVAEQQGKYLARVLNESAARLEPSEPPPFVYRHMGSMATLGEPGPALLHSCITRRGQLGGSCRLLACVRRACYQLCCMVRRPGGLLPASPSASRPQLLLLTCLSGASGGERAVLEIGDGKQPKLSWAGFSSWVAWRRQEAAAGGDAILPSCHALVSALLADCRMRPALAACFCLEDLLGVAAQPAARPAIQPALASLPS